MAHVDYIKPIEALHGKLEKTDKVGYAKRQLEGTKYTFTCKPRNYEPTTAQQLHTKKFGDVCKWRTMFLQDPTKRTQYIAAYKASGKSGSMTLQTYVWKDIWANYSTIKAEMDRDA